MERAFEIASLSFALVTIILGILTFIKPWNLSRVFIVFLTIGFLTDLFRERYLEVMPLMPKLIYYIYTLFEGLFFMGWPLYQIYRRRRIAFVILATIPIIWIMVHVDFHYLTLRYNAYNNAYVSGYEVLSAFLCSYVLLKITQENEFFIKMPLFWFTSGIFTYTFTTYFISAFAKVVSDLNIWWIHNAIAIVVSAMYSIGFVLVWTVNDSAVKPIARKRIY